MSQLIDQITENAKTAKVNIPVVAPPSKVLAIGCVDARINTRKIKKEDGELLFPNGKSLVRNIAARILGPGHGVDSEDEAAMLHQAIEKDHVTRIVLMGHTHCGGINACSCGTGGPHLKRYLATLESEHEEAKKCLGSDEDRKRVLEGLSVESSMNNLMKYEVVRKAVEAGNLTIEPYVLNTGKQQAIDLRTHKGPLPNDPAPEHRPEMVIFCDRDQMLMPQDDLKLEDGKALIFRTYDGKVKGNAAFSLKEAAMVEFALANPTVKDIVVLGKARPDDSLRAQADKQTELFQSRQNLLSYPELQKAVEVDKKIALHAWFIDGQGKLQSMDERGISAPIGAAVNHR